MPTKESVADAIRMHRARLRMSREALADACGIPASTLETYENEKANISLSNACKLADFFGISLDELSAPSKGE